MPPIIGVTSNLGLDTESDPHRERSYLLAAYTEAILAAGGIPHPLPVPREYDDARIDQLLGSIDGLMLTGGFDLHPRHFGQQLHPKTTPMHEWRDRFEVDLVRRADATGIPMLAICLGFQILHVVRGGRLIQHVDELALEPPITHYLPRDRNAYHSVRIESDALLARVMETTRCEVTSRHHQIVDPQHQGRGLRPVAYAPDGVLEASEAGDGRWLLAVQWHPEDIIDRPEHLRLFEALVQAADAWRTSVAQKFVDACPAPTRARATRRS